jgi:hypothetical protein
MNIKRTMRTHHENNAHFIFSGMALALALASGSANAELALKFDDPETAGVDFLIRDGEPDDLNPAPGVIDVIIESENGLSVTAAASSSLDQADSQQLRMSIELLEYSRGSLQMALTQTDVVLDEPAGLVGVLGATVTGGQTIRYDFYGDEGNGEFVNGFDILSLGPVETPNGINYPGQEVTVVGLDPDAGSVTLSAFLDQGTFDNTNYVAADLIWTPYKKATRGVEYL